MRLWSHDKLIARFMSKSDLADCEVTFEKKPRDNLIIPRQGHIVHSGKNGVLVRAAASFSGPAAASSVATLGNCLAGDGVAWREISQKLNFCTEWEENRHFLAVPALHTTEIECIF
jgi:hypothetical protein